MLAAALLLASLSGCQWSVRLQTKLDQLQDQLLSDPQLAASAAVDALLPVSGYTGQTDNLEHMTAGEDGNERLTVYLELAYGLSDRTWIDAAVIRATGASAFELAVLHLENEYNAVQTAALFTAYLDRREGDFTGYAPEQAAMVANADIVQEGTYVALCICPEPNQAADTFRSLILGSDPAEPGIADSVPPSAVIPSDRIPQSASPTQKPQETPYVATYPGRCDFTQPNIDDMSIYDTSAILAAWKFDDSSVLSDYDKDIYNAARSVLNSVLRDGMSDLEKETAVYYWIVNNVNYDWTHQDVMSRTPRESFTPYGGLVNHTAVCLGFATTFHLLMDMAGVECITVVGAARLSTEDHGWNMVRLNGNWYCVDVTWDANNREYGYSWGRESDWNYFNITSDAMAATNHQWDYANVPEAVTWGNGRD